MDEILTSAGGAEPLLRILFVDDEVKVLAGLQRMLRPQRHNWDMSFANGFEQALAFMEKSPVDVIVTDMRMPGMGGAGLLELVRARFPGVIRIVLSGQFDVDSGLRAVPVAHQFLTKPCDAEKLRSAIARSAQPTTGRPNEATRRIVAAVGTLPSPPAVCTELMAAIQDPAIAIEAIVRIIDRDVAVSAKVLQLANSAFFSIPREVTTVSAAVNFLGLEVLRQLVVSAGILKSFKPVRPITGFSLDDFERHSHTTAAIASEIWAKDKRRCEGVMAALLHDTGKLVLAARLPAKFEDVLVEAQRDGRPSHECELNMFGASHAEIGGYLLGLWGLPPVVVDAVSAHHRPAAPSDTRGELSLRAIVHFSNALANESPAAGAMLPPVPAGLDPVYLSALGFRERIPEWRALAQKNGTSKSP